MYLNVDMNEDELVDFLFEVLVDEAIEFVTGVPVTPVRFFLRFVNWLDERDQVHQQAAAQALRKYIDYGNLPSGHFDYGRL